MVQFILLLIGIIFIVKVNKFFNLNFLDKKYVYLLLIINIFFSFSLQAVYTFYHTDTSTADVYKYFEDARIIYSKKGEYPKEVAAILFGVQDFLSNQNLSDEINFLNTPKRSIFRASSALMVRLNLLIMFVSGGYLFFHILLFSFLAFVGKFLIIKTIDTYFEAFTKASFVSIVLFPSVNFWASGMLKETLIFFFLGLGLYSITLKNRVAKTVLTLFSLVLLWILKPYILVLIAFILSTYTFYYYRKYLISKLVVIALISSIYIFNLFEKIFTAGITVRKEFTALALEQNAGSWVDLNTYHYNLKDIIKLMSMSLYSTYISPLFAGIDLRIMDWWFLLENVLLFAIISIGLIHLSSLNKIIKQRLFVCSFMFGLLFIFIVGLSVPVLGAIVRYTVIGIPFLIFPFISVLNPYLEKYLK